MEINEYCEVRGCNGESDYGWTYLGVLNCPKVQICSYHWGLHANCRLKWNLFDEFGYPKPPVSDPKPLTVRLRVKQDETEIAPVYSSVPCECGKQKLRHTIYCPECAEKNRKESGRKRIKNHRDLKKGQNGCDISM